MSYVSVSVLVTNTMVIIRSPYDSDLVDMIRMLTTRTWDADKKLWWTPLYVLDEVHTMLSRWRGTVTFTDARTASAGSTAEQERHERLRDNYQSKRQEEQKKRDRSYGQNSAPHGKKTWADTMFEVVPDELAAALYKKMLLVLHPDTGGDVEITKIVNAAWERKNKK